MKIIDYFKMTINMLKVRKFRSIINILAISIGTMFIMGMVSIGVGVQKYCMNKVSEFNDFRRITMYNTKYQTDEDIEKKLANSNLDTEEIFNLQKIDDKTIDTLKQRNDIEEILKSYKTDVHEISFNNKKIKDSTIAYYDEKKSYLDSELQNLKHANNKDNNYIIEGKGFSDDSENSVLIPENILYNSFNITDIKQVIGEKISITDIIPDYENDKQCTIEATIIGVINQSYYQPSILVSKDIMKQIKNFQLKNDKTDNEVLETNVNETDVNQVVETGGTDKIIEEKELEEMGYDQLEISTIDIKNVPTVVKYIENDLGYSTESIQAVASTVDKALNIIKIILSLVGIIITGVALLGVANTMMMSIYERTKLIGIMKATGASKNNIRNLFLFEGAIIGFLGGILGIVLSKIGLIIINKIISVNLVALGFVDTSFLNNILLLDKNVVIGTLLLLLISIIIASVYPAIVACRLNPIDALRHD